MKEIDLETLIAYDKEIRRIVDTNSSELILNDSIAHAAIVQSAILDKARTEKLPVDMYCGEFSIYQDKTKNKVEEVVPALKKANADTTFHPYWKLLDSLKAFFDAGGTMNVILDRELTGLSEQNLWEYIKSPIAQKHLNFYKLSNDFGLDHFTVSGRMYRRENSDSEKTAFCCFNSDKAQILKTAFGILSETSIPTEVF